LGTIRFNPNDRSHNRGESENNEMKFVGMIEMKVEQGKEISFEVRQVNIPDARRNVHKMKVPQLSFPDLEY
jgi:hypothetical protein